MASKDDKRPSAFAEDLTGRRPGAAARAEAEALRAAAPVRTLLARLLGVHTEERAWRIGAEGEERVGRELARLGPAWTTLHAIPVGDRGADIDHLVVGPGGVFTVNTKHHPDARVWVGERAMRVNGRPVAYLPKAAYEAERAGALLTVASGIPVAARSLVVLTGVESLKVAEGPTSAVTVRGRQGLARWFTRQPEALDVIAVRRVIDVARRPEVWVRRP